jgi:hypothetical protein
MIAHPYDLRKNLLMNWTWHNATRLTPRGPHAARHKRRQSACLASRGPAGRRQTSAHTAAAPGRSEDSWRRRLVTGWYGRGGQWSRSIWLVMQREMTKVELRKKADPNKREALWTFMAAIGAGGRRAPVHHATMSVSLVPAAAGGSSAVCPSPAGADRCLCPNDPMD